jgi:2-oxoisovalerate dehydrogenase E2 component (dihydrolipoyl transacylase)
MSTPEKDTVFKLPDLGEGLEGATIVQWLVKIGDTVKLGDLLVEVETVKSAVEIPSPCDGVIAKLHANEGDELAVGASLVTFESGDAAPAEQKNEPRVAPTHIEPDVKAEPNHEPVREEQKTVAPTSSHSNARAMPAVRQRAAELGIDIEQVKGTGEGSVVVMSDVESATAPALEKSGKDTGAGTPLTGSRLEMCKHMERSLEVVPVTIMDDARVALWRWSVPVMSRLVCAIIAGCKAAPELNAWFDSGTRMLELHTRIDLGIAVSTPHGLFVPVLAGVESRNESDIRAALKELVAQTRKGKIYTDAGRAPTITLTNFGPLGGKYATPIIVPPQVAILGVGAAYSMWPPIEKRLPLSLTFDHRVVTGEEASRFLAAAKADLEK